MTDQDKRVLLSIPFAREGGITQEALARKLGIGKCSARKSIENLQNDNWPVVNFQDGTGYFIAESAEEVTHYQKQEHKRARSIKDKCGQIKYWPDIRDKVAEIREAVNK